jgi:hypothetical protein
VLASDRFGDSMLQFKGESKMNKLCRHMMFGTAGVVVMALTPAIGAGAAGLPPLPILPGTVTCNQSQGVWSGAIQFNPPLFSNGTATTETMIVRATLGNSASPCVTTAGFVATGSILGKITFTGAKANRCSKVFNGLSRVPISTSKFKLTWSTPPGAPTVWKPPPPFSFVGALGMTSLTVTGGKVTGSFSPYATPTATLSDSNWATVIPTGCASTAGVSSLTLSTSSGTW